MDKNSCRFPCNTMPIIYQCDYSKAIRHNIHPDRIADFHVLVYVIDGEIEVFEENIKYLLKKDSLLFLKKGCHHFGTKPFKKDTSWYYIHFNYLYENEAVFELTKDSSLHADKEKDLSHFYMTMPKILHLNPNNNIKQKIHNIINQSNGGKHMNALMNLHNLFYTIYKLDEKIITYKTSEGKVRELINYIDLNYNKDITPNTISKITSLSYKYVAALFKSQTSTTIKQYQLSLKLERAKDLLSDTDMLISEIAKEVNFYDEFYFSKLFKKRYGLSPLKYRFTYTPKI